jgi:single-strand DNA-binding protein
MLSMLFIIGRLGKDPESRTTKAGSATANFSVAHNRKYTNSNGVLVKETTWFNVTAWGKQADAIIKYLSKGSKVAVVGRLIPDAETGGPRLWTGNDGIVRSSFEVNASTVKFLDDAPPSSSSPEPPPLDGEEFPF